MLVMRGVVDEREGEVLAGGDAGERADGPVGGGEAGGVEDVAGVHGGEGVGG